MNNEIDLVAVGNAIVDVLTKIDDGFLEVNGLTKGSMELIDTERAELLYGRMGPATEVSGGSAANTMAGFASLGGKGAYIGKVANDQLGKVFHHDMNASGIEYKTAPLEQGEPTARCLVLVTPDAERTMATFLGASTWISPEDIDQGLIASAKVTYLEGYLFDRDRAKQAFIKASEIAHSAGKKVALTLSDSFCVDRHREEFQDLVKNHVDILFGNTAEIKALYETDSFDEAINSIRGHCELAALTRGSQGCGILTADDYIEVPGETVDRLVDTTGAGDQFAAGFLYGYTRGLDLPTCGKLACVSAAEVITHMGARPLCPLGDLVRTKKII